MKIGDFAQHTAPFLWLVVLGVVLIVERCRPARSTERGDWRTNLWAWILTFAAAFTTSPLAAGAATLLVNAAGGGLIVLPDKGWGLALGVAAYLTVMDCGEYWFHRAQHALPLLWAMHSLHHSDPAVNVMTANRHYWLEAALKSVTIWLAVGLIFKASAPIVAIYAMIHLYNLVLHANLRLGFGPLSWLVNSPQYHRLHHSRDPRHHGANYAALLSFFDVLGGTYRRPEPGEFPETGLDDHPAPDGVWQVFAWPFAFAGPRRAGQMTKSALGGPA